MKKISAEQLSADYYKIESAIRFLEQNHRNRPSLDEIAAHVGLSKFHFARLFKEWAGITPNQFLQVLSLDYAKTQLNKSRSVLEAALDGGFSGPGRLHDLFVSIEAVTPGEYKSFGVGLAIDYCFSPTPFGECLLASTRRGICFLGFHDTEQRDTSLLQLMGSWKGACFTERPELVNLVEMIFNRFTGPVQQDGSVNNRASHSPDNNLRLFVKGTNFQVQVWKALLTIPKGHFVTYSDIASLAGNRKAVRASASAVASNPVAYLIPCHRVISSTGKIHNYRWGGMRKKAMTVRESRY